jgi:hypothetical protein
MVKHNAFTQLLLYITLLSIPASAAASQGEIEEGRPIVILLTPLMTYAGSLDDGLPRYGTAALEGLFSPEKAGMFDKLYAFEILMHGIFYNGLAVSPEERMVILAIPPGNTRETWLNIVSILFDRFNVPSLYIHEAGTWDDAITPELTPGQKLYWTSENNNG